MDAISDYLAPIGFLGAGVTMGLGIYEARGAHRCYYLKNIAKILEQRMGFDEKTGQFLAEPKPILGLVREGVAGIVVYLAVFAGWLLLAAQG